MKALFLIMMLLAGTVNAQTVQMRGTTGNTCAKYSVVTVNAKGSVTVVCDSGTGGGGGGDTGGEDNTTPTITCKTPVFPPAICYSPSEGFPACWPTNFANVSETPGFYDRFPGHTTPWPHEMVNKWYGARAIVLQGGVGYGKVNFDAWWWKRIMNPNSNYVTTSVTNGVTTQEWQEWPWTIIGETTDAPGRGAYGRPADNMNFHMSVNTCPGDSTGYSAVQGCELPTGGKGIFVRGVHSDDQIQRATVARAAFGQKPCVIDADKDYYFTFDSAETVSGHTDWDVAFLFMLR